jgi:fermentation-respiration switch protein FrsA (DUF1100 family)
MSKLLKTFIVMLLLSGASHAGVIERFLYPGANDELETPNAALKSFENILIEIEEDQSIILRGPKLEESYEGSIMLFFHGNAGNYFNGDYFHYKFTEILGEENLKVYSIQYPGYAGSKIKPTQASLTKAGLKALELLGKVYPNNKKIIMGFSLGSAVSIQVATKTKVKYDQVVLNSPWKSFKKICSFNALIFQAFFCKDKTQAYKNTDLIGKIKSPVVILHGKRDMTVPFYHGKANFKALQKADRPYKDEFFPVSTGHNNLFTDENLLIISTFL